MYTHIKKNIIYILYRWYVKQGQKERSKRNDWSKNKNINIQQTHL